MSSFEIVTSPRFRDTDMLGHVNNAVYLTYLEIARSEWFMQIRHAGSTFTFILARMEIDYTHPIVLGEDIKVKMWVSSIGNKSWVFDYIITSPDGSVMYAKASSVQVFYDYQKNTSRALPDDVRVELERLKE